MGMINEDIKTGQDFEQTLAEGSREELDGLKAWLFKENIRLESVRIELKLKEDKLNEEKKQFQSEIEDVSRRIQTAQSRLKQDETFFEKKMDILKNGFAQLDEERKKFEREKIGFEATKDAISRREMDYGIADLLFQGVKSQLALKKRYKDLLKMFHPDNIAGDHEMVVVINNAYERLKREYEGGKQAMG